MERAAMPATPGDGAPRRLAWHGAPHLARCGAACRASSASSSAIRAVSGAVTARTSSSVNRSVMCWGQFQSKS